MRRPNPGYDSPIPGEKGHPCICCQKRGTSKCPYCEKNCSQGTHVESARRVERLEK